jgi:hypothetical protein
LRQFGCLTGAKKVCWPPFTILWLLEPTLKGDLIVLGFYGVVKIDRELPRKFINVVGRKPVANVDNTVS